MKLCKVCWSLSQKRRCDDDSSSRETHSQIRDGIIAKASMQCPIQEITQQKYCLQALKLLNGNLDPKWLGKGSPQENPESHEERTKPRPQRRHLHRCNYMTLIRGVSSTTCYPQVQDCLDELSNLSTFTRACLNLPALIE